MGGGWCVKVGFLEVFFIHDTVSVGDLAARGPFCSCS